ncbi:MAG: hypothetical protein ACSHWZ_15795 [Sulfitobacter sp.]
MSTAPLKRDEQLRFMTEAPARHAALIERWMDDPQISCMLTQRVEVTESSELSDAEVYMQARLA